MNKTEDGYSIYLTWGKFINETQGATQLEIRLSLSHVEPLKQDFYY